MLPLFSHPREITKRRHWNQLGISSSLRWLFKYSKSQVFVGPEVREKGMPDVSSVQFSCSVVSDSLPPHESQHTRPPCPSPTPGVHSNSRPSSRWYHPAISSSVIPLSSCPQSLPASVFSNESTLHMRWPKYWSFSFSITPSKEHPGKVKKLA